MTENDYKKKAENFVTEVDEFAKGKLNNTDDLTRFIEIIFKMKEHELLEELAFSAKYSQGLLKIIQNRNNNFEDDYFEKITSEYTESVKKIRGLLEKVIENASTFVKNIFSEKYLSMTHEGMNNLNLLMADLSWVKLFINDKKRSL